MPFSSRLSLPGNPTATCALCLQQDKSFRSAMALPRSSRGHARRRSLEILTLRAQGGSADSPLARAASQFAAGFSASGRGARPLRASCSASGSRSPSPGCRPERASAAGRRGRRPLPPATVSGASGSRWVRCASSGPQVFSAAVSLHRYATRWRRLWTSASSIDARRLRLRAPGGDGRPAPLPAGTSARTPDT
jgi:hypothetical protein